ncbi:hypothetical protein J6590_038717 [Homalodisca vitripennis]|nr:hypothetical protein J6590_038717 [Homalodisca vitripennis]
MEDRAKSHWTFFVVHFIPDHEFFVRSELAPTVRPLSGLQKMPAGIGENLLWMLDWISFSGTYTHSPATHP